MRFIYKLERKFARFGVPNLMIYVTATMLVVFLMDYLIDLPTPLYTLLGFNRGLIFRGEVWRLISFAVLPPSYDPLWLLVGLYFYYFIGTSLEGVWGAPRFTLYYMFGVLGAIIAGFIMGGTTNIYLNMSLFFAFANLYPNQELLVFFVFPVKVKYLAFIDWFFFIVSFLFGSMQIRAAVVFSIINYILFFGPDIYSKIKNNARYSKTRREFRKQMGQDRDLWR